MMPRNVLFTDPNEILSGDEVCDNLVLPYPNINRIHDTYLAPRMLPFHILIIQMIRTSDANEFAEYYPGTETTIRPREGKGRTSTLSK